MIKLFESIRYKYDLWNLFSDFVELTAISISNAVNYRQEKEDRYLEIITRCEEKEIFPKLLEELVDALENEVTDVLGEVFMELNLGNSWRGQFFTPYHICQLTTAMTFNCKDIKDKGYIELNEPCCGGGAMVIAFAEVMKKEGYNPQKQLKVICNDLDIRCVYMTYVQLSLLGIPAVVMHMNTLSLEFYDSYKTPMWKLGLWDYK